MGNRGIELCAVVEQMYSLQYMFRVEGDPTFLDRMERIAYNVLPGTITADSWQHQYLQQVNEINASYNTNPHVWQTDGDASTGVQYFPGKRRRQLDGGLVASRQSRLQGG